MRRRPGHFPVVLAVSAMLGGSVVAGSAAENGEREDGTIFAAGEKLEKLAGEFRFTEGPACDDQGNVYFTDQPNDRILVWSTEGTLSTYMQPSGRSNGLCFDDRGNLWACADTSNQLWCISPTKSVDVVVDAYQDKLLNGPNDVWIHPDGGIYFSDPYYQRDYWTRGPSEQEVAGVYYVTPDHRRTIRVAEDLRAPNGLIGTPDGKRLYVADIGAGKTYRYTIHDDGSLRDQELFCGLGSDGMTIDDQGNLYLTGRGVTVFNPAGRQIARIDVDAGWTANVCFGGTDRRTLFITAGESLFGLKLSVRGVGSQ